MTDDCRSCLTCIDSDPSCPECRGVDLADKFMQMMEAHGPDECWPWTGAKTTAGYGLFFVAKTIDGKIVQIVQTAARRFMWRMSRGVPAPSLVQAICDNRLCVNPAHLEQVVRKPKPPRLPQARGERVHAAKSTEDEVREIRREYQRGVRGHGYHVLANRYGLCVTTIKRMVDRVTWRHVE